MQRGELPVRDPAQPRSILVVDTYHHRGETIRLVNKGLSDPAKAASDEMIAAVSTLLTIEVSMKHIISQKGELTRSSVTDCFWES